MKIYSAQLKGTTTVATGSNVSLTGSFSGSIAGIDINANNTFTSSTNTFTASISETNTFTSSTSARLSSIETITASNTARIGALETHSASVDTTNTTQNTRLINLENKTGSLASTGSNTFYGTQIISGTTWIAGDFIVQGSSSIQYISASSVSIGTNIVNLNTANPAVRYGGISVQDSGSANGVTGSMLWDSTCNRWIYSNPSGVGYSGGVLMSGPRAATLGTETTLTCNYIAKSGGGDHLYDSCIWEMSGSVGINCSSPGFNLDVNGTLNVATSTGSQIRMIAYGGSSAKIKGTQGTLGIEALGALTLETNGANERLRIESSGISTFSCQICAPHFRIENGDGVASVIRQTNASSYSSLRLYNDQNSANRALEIDYFGSTYAAPGERAEIFVTGNYPMLLGTSNVCRFSILGNGITQFACQVCSPQYITTQGSSVSYTTGTHYTIWNSEIESCIQDSNNPAAYTRIKTWIADRSGCATIRYTGYIQSGPTYWGYRVTRNGTSSYMCVSYSDCGQLGCAAPYVHSYSSYEFNVGPFLPGDCIGLDVVSTGGGATPSVGQGQWIYAKEFRVFSSTPNLSAGSPNNVFGEFVGIGTPYPLSNLEIRGSNTAAYDCTVDNGQDGCGVTLTVRNGSTVNNTFSQINMQVSGDSGRALGRIVTIRKDSASSHMAFIIETANTKKEIMRIGCYGASSHNFLMVGRSTAGISQGDNGITLNATSGQIEAVVNGDDILNLNRKTSDGKIIRLFKDSVEVGSIHTNTYSLPSDINFKTNINNLNLGLNLVNKLRPVSYNHKIDDCGSALSTGFIAQEMQCVLDELGIEKNKYFILQHTPGNDTNQSQYWLDYTKMIPVLTKAIQEQQCIICYQSQKITLLESCIGIN